MRIDLPLINPSNSSCAGCHALCCHNLTLPAPAPTTEDRLRDLKWRLHFDTVKICVMDKRWFMIVSGRCRFLDDRNMCVIYEHRPTQCREYNPPYCERYIDPGALVFHTPADLEAYLEQFGGLMPEPSRESTTTSET